jgi:DNA-binding XRE family transcriptional regulator
MNLPKPIAEDTETVTLRRADYESLIGNLEDAIDGAALKSLGERLRMSEADALADYLSGERVERLVAGENPVRIWREHRGLSARALAAAARVTPTYLSEIETGRKPGSLGTMAKIAHALGISLDDLVPSPN